jgi:hypothetical protein
MLVGQSWVSSGSFTQSDFSLCGDVAANSLSDAVGIYMQSDGSSISLFASEANISGLNSGVVWSTPLPVSSGTSDGFPKIATTYFSSGTVQAAAVWLSSDGVSISVQCAVGLRTCLLAPNDVAVQQASENLGLFTNYYNTISWSPSLDPTASGYVIYQNGVYFKVVNPDVTSVIEHNATQNGVVTYGVAAINDQKQQSAVINVSLP